jgi:UDP-N-acetylmuramoylalanine--D-glutamate ligase
MGLGLHGGGVGIVRFLSSAGAIVTVTDMKSKEELAVSLEKLKGLKNIRFVLQQHRPEDFAKTDMVIKNPGISWNNKHVKLALDNKIPVEMDSSLFFKLTKNLTIGVTGTKGKTTTATLIFEIIKASGKDAIKVGIGQTSVLDKIKDLKKDTIVVFELSSWRLSALGRAKISPKIAVITNIYPDHMDYYKSMDEYIHDKKHIFLHQDRSDSSVISADNALVNRFQEEIRSNLIRFSRHKINSGKSVYVDDGNIYINDGVDEKKVISLSDIKIRGSHNVENVLAAIGAAWAIGIGKDAILSAILKFTGVPHRLETIRELDGVEYVNDTAATTPEAAISGIEAFSEPVILIGGGSDKKLDTAELAKVICQKTKEAVFLKGTGTDKIIAEIKKVGCFLNFKYSIADSMEEAIETARSLAQSGDVVLLSPGAASFGMFVNEFDRGERFREAVMNLQ